jgi:hypothetical protein
MEIILTEEQISSLSERLAVKLTPEIIDKEVKRIKKLAKGYKTITDFGNNYPKEGRWIVHNRLTNQIFPELNDRKPFGYWNEKTARREAKKYKTRKDLIAFSPQAYKVLSDLNLLHKVFPIKGRGEDYYYNRGLIRIKQFLESENFNIETLKILNARVSYDLKKHDDENPTNPISNKVYTKIKKIIKDTGLDNPEVNKNRQIINVISLVKDNFELKQSLLPVTCGNIGRFIQDPNNIHPDLLMFIPKRVYSIIKEHDTQFPNNPWLNKFLRKLKRITKYIASAFEEKQRFAESYPKLYTTIRYHDTLFPDDPWMDNIVKWTKVGGQTEKLVYVYEWPVDKKGIKYAYVGLTYNENKRDKEHNDDTAKDLSPVIKHIQKTNVKPIKKILSDGYIDYISAGKLECSAMEDYKDNNWTLLNTAPCGSFGGVVNVRIMKNQYLDFFKKPNNTDINQLKNIPGGDYVYKMVIQPNNFDELFYNKIEKIVRKYDIKSMSSLRYDFGGRRAVSTIEQHDKVHPENKWMVKLFNTVSFKEQMEPNLKKFLENPNNTDSNQLNLITKSLYKLVTPEIENKFLTKFKKIIDKNNIKLISRDKINILPSGAYMCIRNHDLESPNNWKSYLYPESRQINSKKEKLNESKLSFENILKGILLENDKPTIHPKNKVLIQKAEFAYTKLKNGTYLFQDDVRQRTAVLWELPDEVEFGFVHDPENGNTPKITLNSDMKGTIVYTIYNDDRTIKKISETNLLKIPILGDATHFPYKYTCMHIKKLMGRLGRTHINFNGYSPEWDR